MKQTIAITGGIGAGKSVVCHLLSILGFPVYDCDSRARKLMDSDSDMRARIAAEISPGALNSDGSINRGRLSGIVFSDSDKLRKLNDIVHGAVKQDFIAWRNSLKAEMIFIETAILYESGFDSLADNVWEVTAPEEIRIQRVQKRSSLTADEIRRRIAAQRPPDNPKHQLIINDNTTPMLPRIFNLLKK